MAEVMIKCPKTGDEVPVGISISKEVWDSDGVRFDNNASGPCPSCGDSHTWSKSDAFLRD